MHGCESTGWLSLETRHTEQHTHKKASPSKNVSLHTVQMHEDIESSVFKSSPGFLPIYDQKVGLK